VTLYDGTDFERTGYTLTGWTINGETYALGETVEENFTSVQNGTVQAKAVWTPITYSIRYDAGEGTYTGSLPNSKSGWLIIKNGYTYDAPVTLYSGADFQRDGYKLTGWTIGGETYALGETVEKNFTSVQNGTVQAKAVWTPITYSIRYDAGEGTYTGSLPNSKSGWLIIKNGYTYDDPVTLYNGADFERTGYKLTGWTIGGTTYDLGETVEKNFTNRQSGTVQAYAVWTANTYTVKFDANGGDGSMADQSFTYDEAQNLTPNAFTKKGHTFTGWKFGETEYADGAEVSNLTAEANGEVTLTAIWTPNEYTIAFNGNGGEGDMGDIARTYGDKQPLPECGYTYKGHTFTGWNTKADGTGSDYQPGDKYNLVSSNGKVVTLYAQWKANSYTVKFDANGGEGTMADITRTFGDKQALPECGFTMTGYQFIGWNTKADGTGSDYQPGDKYNLVATDGKVVTLYAQWEQVVFTVTLDPNQGYVSPETVLVTYGQPYGELPVPVRTGFTFTGWTLRDGTPITTETIYTIAGDSELVAMWEINEYTVTFDANRGKAVDPQIVQYGDTATEPTTYRPGHRFKGWYLDGARYDFNTPVTQDITLTAKWKEKKPASVVVLHKCPSEKFTDVNQSLWYHEGIDYAIEKGLMNGVSDTRFNPDGTTTRAMIVTILYRLEGEPAVTGSANFTDVPAGEWYTNAVNWAAANKIVNGFGDGTFGPTTPITREQVAAIFERYAEFKGMDTDSTGNVADFICSDWAKGNVSWADSIGLFDIGTEVSDLTQTASRAEIACYFKVFHPLFDK